MHATPPRAAIAARAATRAVLAASLLALAACGSSVGPTPPPPPACKGYDQACGAGAECCSGDCPAGACGCSATGERCGTSNDCCTALGPARCDAGACVSGQRALGDVCTLDGQCASLNCDLGGHCAAACSRTPGTACTDRSQCCPSMGCVAGQCSLACGGAYDACATDADCCSDRTCRAGECQTGLCGVLGQTCAADADSCTAAQGGKNYFCEYQTCTIGRPYDWPGAAPDACATDADCAVGSPCRGGYCHWPDGRQADGHWCLDGQECDSGICAGASLAPGAPAVPGTCCSGGGAACTAGSSSTICCEPYACTGVAGAQSCGSCLDFTNSGPQGTSETQCTSLAQCCEGRNLSCVAGECCTVRGHACTAGTGAKECCFGDTCGSVTTYAGTTTQCCGDYGATCYGGACCDGFICTSGTCLKGPGQPCTGTGQCSEFNGVECDVAAGTCCAHPDAACKADADCCTNDCDEAAGRCRYAPAYGTCLDDGDCIGPDWDQDWTTPVCGGNASLGPDVCCPVSGDACPSAADCCLPSDACRAPLVGADTTTPICCREAQTVCSKNEECCTGSCQSVYTGTDWSGSCCAYPWTPGFTCTTNADCCSNTRTGYNGSRCGDDRGVQRCCWDPGFPIGDAGDPSLCCSGRIHVGACQ